MELEEGYGYHASNPLAIEGEQVVNDSGSSHPRPVPPPRPSAPKFPPASHKSQLQPPSTIAAPALPINVAMHF